jgi:putative DNA primase/helicase
MQSTEVVLQGALDLASRGYRVFPIGISKQPSVTGGFYAATDNPETIRAWSESGQLKNVGIATGALSGICVTDADTEEARDRLRAEYGPETVTSARGAHWYWKHPGQKVASKPLGGGVDSKADGGYVIAPPSTGKKWTNGIPTNLRIIPKALLPTTKAPTSAAGAIPEEHFEAAVRVLAENYPAPGDQYEAGRHLAGYLMGNGVSEEDAYNLMLEALARAGGIDKDAAYNIGRVTSTTAQKLQAGEHVTGGPSLEEYCQGLPRKIALALAWKSKSYPWSDPGNAERFVDLHGKDYRYVQEWSSWARYDGRRWVQTYQAPIAWAMVDTLRVMHAQAAEITNTDEKLGPTRETMQKFARASENGSRIDAAVKLARGRLSMSVEEFDTDPYLLNVANGTLDLRTGKLKAHNRDDLITMMAPVEFDPTAKAPRFRKFLKQTLVDDELIAFVQRFLGYSLTGTTKERTMAVLHGVGKNGKSTLVELFQDLLGDYSSVTAPNVIMKQKFSDPTGQYALAELKGKRFVSVSETKRGVELEESTVKQITGNDTISARAPYGKPFAYRPQFKLWMSTNHKPEIPDGSEAIWDRLRLIPFTKRFDGKKADPDLSDKLREELAGVLAWAVEGVVAWRAQGLGTSKVVEAATQKYRSETDVLDRFFDDECEFGPKKRVSKKDLFDAWERWCDAEGADAGTQTAFTRTVGERGVVRNFAEGKVEGVRVWRGIGLLERPPSDPQSAPPQKSWKQGGRSTDPGHFTEDFQEVAPESPHEGTSGEMAEKCPEVPRDEITPPFEGEIDGVSVKYVDARESE